MLSVSAAMKSPVRPPGQDDCAVCHSPRKRTDAFHEQCINCHENFGVGPSGAESDCKKCHGF